MAVTELVTISGSLSRLVRSRWTDGEIMKHVAVKLPAPIFDRLVVELQQELTFAFAVPVPDFIARGHFEFEGVRYERVAGTYWSLADFGRG